jgi:hypothetical protein
MKKSVKWRFAIAALAISCFHGNARADDAIILDRMDNTIISGTITRIQNDSVFIDYSGRTVEIDMNDMDVNNLNNLFAPGMKITAKGKLEDDGYTPKMEAEEVVRAEAGAVNDSEALFLLNEDKD